MCIAYTHYELRWVLMLHIVFRSSSRSLEAASTIIRFLFLDE